MIRSTLKLLVQMIGFLTLVLGIGVGVAVWQLSKGPIEVPFLKPQIEKALSSDDGKVAVRMASIELAWEGWHRNLDLRARDLRAYGPDGRALASMPVVSLSLSAPALLDGVVAPKTIELFDTRLQFGRDAEGNIAFGLGEAPGGDGSGGQDISADLLTRILAKPDPQSPIAHLTSVRVVNARVSVVDHVMNMSWSASRVNLEVRRVADGIAGSGTLALALPEGEAEVEVDALFDSGDKSFKFDTRFADLRPAAFADMVPALAPIKAADLPLSGTVSGMVEADGTLADLSFEIDAGKGELALPAPVDTVYPVAGLKVQGTARNGLQSVDLPVVEIDLGGPLVTVEAHGKGLGSGDAWISLKANLTDLPVDRLKDVWPAALAPDPREWIVTHLSRGTVTKAWVETVFNGPDLDHLAVDFLTGEVHPEGVTVDYLPPMPPVQDVKALVAVGADAVTITVDKGAAEGSTVTGGRIDLTDLTADTQWAEISLDLVGGLRDAMKLLDHEPLRYPTKLGMAPTRTSGVATTKVHLRFPLEKSLDLDGIDVTAEADLEQAGIKNVVLGKDLSEGKLHLTVDKKGMDVDGTAALAEVPIAVSWRENFADRKEFASRYNIVADLDDERRKKLDLTFQPLVVPFLTGRTHSELTVTMDRQGRGAIGAQIDLKDARLTLPGMEWVKPPGTPATANVSVRFSGKGVQDIPSFSVTSPLDDFSIHGAVQMHGAGGTASRVDIQRFTLGLTDFGGFLEIKPDDSLVVDIRGKSFDALPFLREERDPLLKELTSKEAPPLPAAFIHVELGRVKVSERGFLRDVYGDIKRDDEHWQALNISAEITDGKPLLIGLTPFDGGRDFSISTEDTGAFLRLFDLFDDMHEGALEVSGTVDWSGLTQARARITDFRIRNAPALAKLLSLVSPTGVFETMGGEGLYFSTFDVPFTYHNGVAVLQQSRAFGPSLGLTASGKMNIDEKTVDLEGTVVPSYMFNSLLGHIPLLGPLLVGEEGSGLFAATYTMRGNLLSPDISVNPLSALTPGFLRNIFGLFDNEGSDDAKPKDDGGTGK